MSKKEMVSLGNETVKEVLNCVKGFKQPKNHAHIKFFTEKRRDKAVHSITAVADGIMLEKLFLSSIPNGVEITGEKPLFEAVCSLSEFIEKLSALSNLGEDIKIENQEVLLPVQAGKRASVIVNKCQETEMEAMLPQNEEDVLFNMIIKGTDFKKLVKRGCYAYGEDSPYMKGSITFVLNDCCLTAYSTDGYMMAKSSCVVEREDAQKEVHDEDGNPIVLEDGSVKTENAFLQYCKEEGYNESSYVFSIPSGSFKKLVELAQYADKIIVSVCPKQIVVGLPAIMLTIITGNVNGNEGQRFDKFFQQARANRFVIDKEEFSANMGVVMLGEETPVSVCIKKDNLIIQKKNVAMTSQPLVDREGSLNNPVYFDYKKLNKIFGSLENGNVTMELSDEKEAVFFYNGETNAKRTDMSLLLPVRVSKEETSDEEEKTEE